MRRGISLFGALGLLGLLWSSFAFGANDTADQLKQAERLCIKKQFDQAEQVYLNIVQQATDAEQRFSAQRKLAAVYVAQDKQPLATALVQNILSDYAQHERLPHAIHEITESCHKFGQGVKAKEIYEAILKDQPGHTQRIWLDMGSAIASVLVGDKDSAIAVTDRLLNEYRADDRAAEAVGQVAWCHRKRWDYERARVLYRYVVGTWPDNERAIYSQRGIVLTSIMLRDPNSARAGTEGLFTMYSQHKDLPKILISVANEYREHKDYHKARELCQYVVDKHADSQDAIVAQRGVISSYIGLKDDPNTDAAIERLLKDFASDSRIAEVSYRVARELIWKNASKAKGLCEYVIGYWPASEYAIYAKVSLGCLMLQAGDEDAARAVFDKFMSDCQGQPTLPEVMGLVSEAYWNQAMTERAKGLKEQSDLHFGQALAQCQRIIKELPDSPDCAPWAFLCIGEYYRSCGNYDSAIAWYQMLIASWPDSRVTGHAENLMEELQKRQKIERSRIERERSISSAKRDGGGLP